MIRWRLIPLRSRKLLASDPVETDTIREQEAVLVSDPVETDTIKE